MPAGDTGVPGHFHAIGGSGADPASIPPSLREAAPEDRLSTSS